MVGWWSNYPCAGLSGIFKGSGRKPQGWKQERTDPTQRCWAEVKIKMRKDPVFLKHHTKLWQKLERWFIS